MDEKDVKTYIAIKKDLIMDHEGDSGIGLSWNQREYLKKYIDGQHPREIQKEMGLSPKEQARLKNEIKALLLADNDFEMVKLAFRHKVVQKEDYMEDGIKDIALKKIGEAVAEGKIIGVERLDLLANIFELLLSFHQEIEYNQLLLKLRPQK